MLLSVIACVPVAIWSVLVFARGGFWRVSHLFVPPALPRIEGKRIAAVIPARDEAAVIRRTIRSLLAQDYSPPLSIFVVDDHSTDGTAQAAQCDGSVTVIEGKPLPPGWTGKLWALSQGIEAAQQSAPDYLLFTDADIEHAPNGVAQLVSIAESQRRDLVSFMVRLACETPAEKALIPAFVFFFLMLYPPAWIASEKHRTAGAAGGCVLIRPATLQGIGGIPAIRGEVIDDCALARAVKRNGGRLWLGLTPATSSTRSYGTFGEVGRMISRTAFNQLNHSTLLLIGTVAGLVCTYILPFVLVLSGKPAGVASGLLSYALMSSAYYPMVRFYRRSPLWSLALPAVACFYLGATVHSAFRYWTGQGGRWKGRAQDIPKKY